MASRNCFVKLKTFQLRSYNPSNGIVFFRGLCERHQVFQSKCWLQAVSHAEKVAGNPMTFLNLESVTSYEISNMAVYLKKLIETGHPLTSLIKELLINSKAKNDLTRGLLVLLVSKAGQNKPDEEILPNQRKLAEITEKIHTAHTIHSGIVDVLTPNANLEMGNKMAILCGDFIQSRSSIQLAEFKNIKIIDLFGQAIADFSAVEFIDKDKYSALDWWTQQTKMRYGTLLSIAFQSTLILGGNMGLLETAKNFGLEIAFAWQAKIDLQSYKNTTKRAEHILTKLFPSGTPFEEIVLSFEGVRDKHTNASLKMLANFPQNDATLALRDIAKALKY